MTADAQFLITYLTEVETLAEDLLADKHQMVDLDRKRNSNREALRAVQGGAAADQEQLESEMTRIRRELKVKMNRLNEAQGDRASDQDNGPREFESLCKMYNPLPIHCRTKALSQAFLCWSRTGVEDNFVCVGKPELKGFDLAPLSREEMLAINKVIKE